MKPNWNQITSNERLGLVSNFNSLVLVSNFNGDLIKVQRAVCMISNNRAVAKVLQKRYHIL
ncbi:hypothetical protein HanRHA438_Chr15g0694891 [Helianthus annuus]|nr:hypothetical protein HanRHA438_Chr15g0694891 [Helianthus annuus]